MSVVGVLALQGDFVEHAEALAACGARARPVRLPADLDGLDGLVIPGGESTTMTNLLERMGLWAPIASAIDAGLPTLGTCAGLIVLARRVEDGVPGQKGLDALDVTVRRNGYGRQMESFQAPVHLDQSDPFPGVFIRAPILLNTGTTRVIADLEGAPVGVLQGSVMGLAFHPELSGDRRFHQRLLALITAGGVARRSVSR